MEQRRVLSGVILIVIGIVFLAAQRYRLGGEAVVAAIGIAFLAAFAYTRNYGYLVPGGIMTGDWASASCTRPSGPGTRDGRLCWGWDWDSPAFTSWMCSAAGSVPAGGGRWSPEAP